MNKHLILSRNLASYVYIQRRLIKAEMLWQYLEIKSPRGQLNGKTENFLLALSTASDLLFQHHDALPLLGWKQGNLLIRKLKDLHDEGRLKKIKVVVGNKWKVCFKKERNFERITFSWSWFETGAVGKPPMAVLSGPGRATGGTGCKRPNFTTLKSSVIDSASHNAIQKLYLSQNRRNQFMWCNNWPNFKNVTLPAVFPVFLPSCHVRLAGHRVDPVAHSQDCVDRRLHVRKSRVLEFQKPRRVYQTRWFLVAFSDQMNFNEMKAKYFKFCLYDSRTFLSTLVLFG